MVATEKPNLRDTGSTENILSVNCSFTDVRFQLTVDVMVTTVDAIRTALIVVGRFAAERKICEGGGDTVG
jgi:hypothetical protein